jgi:DNA-binding transcriptional MerR regulator
MPASRSVKSNSSGVCTGDSFISSFGAVQMKTNRKAFSAGQAAKAAGVAYHQLNHWATLGVVVPSIQEGKGYGGVRAYSVADVVALKVVNRMKASGFPLRQLQGLAAKIQEWKKSSNKTIFICSENGSVEAFDEQEAVTALRSMAPEGFGWLINISDVAAEVTSRLEANARPSRGKAVRVA